ncbi:glutamine-hydrolyzing carbamoyl-phosphate synthase small subunit [Planctomicrobium sp. SH668]|uniref:glutamine-hydrolyzing carbamoyl-phosphate synthase small subunit n=1 Tax=Planctomicrobium sp. SH668 TaxID=3448126 RepID=UPI003F5BE7BF
MSAPAKLALADGTVYTGTRFGADGEVYGEVVFHTGLTGYQEVITDPSATGQIIAMTYPLIGNTGINVEDLEGPKVALRGFVIRELCHEPSNQRSQKSLSDYLEENNVIGIEGVDTRALVRKIRSVGCMNGVISSIDLDDASLIKKAQTCQDLNGTDLVKEVVPEKAFEWTDGLLPEFLNSTTPSYNPESSKEPGPHIVALDYGMKWNIARYFTELGCRMTVVPGTATAEEVLAYNPDGVFLSNGPGDPVPLTYAVDTIKNLLGKKPILGICLGHQLLGMALGAKTYKLKFGHRGANQPVLNVATGKVEITSQSHTFAVDESTLPAGVKVTHVNLNDQTVEGIAHEELQAWSVQYHPEAASGPHDSNYIFGEFVDRLRPLIAK